MYRMRRAWPGKQRHHHRGYESDPRSAGEGSQRSHCLPGQGTQRRAGLLHRTHAAPRPAKRVRPQKRCCDCKSVPQGSGSGAERRGSRASDAALPGELRDAASGKRTGHLSYRRLPLPGGELYQPHFYEGQPAGKPLGLQGFLPTLLPLRRRRALSDRIHSEGV